MKIVGNRQAPEKRAHSLVTKEAALGSLRLFPTARSFEAFRGPKMSEHFLFVLPQLFAPRFSRFGVMPGSGLKFPQLCTFPGNFCLPSPAWDERIIVAAPTRRACFGSPSEAFRLAVRTGGVCASFPCFGNSWIVTSIQYLVISHSVVLIRRREIAALTHTPGKKSWRKTVHGDESMGRSGHGGGAGFVPRGFIPAEKNYIWGQSQ